MRLLGPAVSITTCIVVVLAVAVMLVLADVHSVTKGEQGPRGSAVVWEYNPTGLGTWSGHVVNNGLR